MLDDIICEENLDTGSSFFNFDRNDPVERNDVSENESKFIFQVESCV